MKEYKKEKESETDLSSECTTVHGDHFVDFPKTLKEIKLK